MVIMKQKLREGEVKNLFNHWMIVETLSLTTEGVLDQMATFMQEKIFDTIKHDGKLLFHTRQCIAFWEKLGRDPQEKLLLATDLLSQAKLLWKTEGKEKKGQQLMELVISLSKSDRSLLDEIEAFLLDLYAQAEDCYLIERLTLIYEAMEHFHITKQESLYPSKLANYLADAQYLYYAHNYARAKIHAAWILKLDPKNNQALRLVGLSSFHLGEYKEAISFLHMLSEPDPYVSKALMISQIFSTHEPTKHLAQIDSTNSFEEDE